MEEPVDVGERLEALREQLRQARTLPMSASCVVNRNELLELIAQLESALPVELEQAVQVLADRDAIVEEGKAQAERAVEAGRRERAELVRKTDLHAEAQTAADALVEQARDEAAGLRRETDDYVDHKLASFEVALNKTLLTAGEAKEKLRERGAVEVAPMLGLTADPEAFRRELDGWVDSKLGRFEHALNKTLDTVVRGREKLRERSHLDQTLDDQADTGAIPRVSATPEDTEEAAD